LEQHPQQQHQQPHTVNQINVNKKRDIPMCMKFHWEQPIYLNISKITDNGQQLYNQNLINNQNHIINEDIDKNSNILRKLESQKGEVCS